MSLETHYESRRAELEAELAQLTATSDGFSRQRGGLVLILLPLSLYGLSRGLPQAAWAAVGVGALVFLLLVIRHAKIASKQAHLEERLKVVAAGMRRLRGEPEPEDPFAVVPPDPHGARFLKAEHPNAGDLDLFGSRSLFAAVSRAETAVGEETLARWLRQPATPTEIELRQQAAMELLDNPRLLEDLTILAKRAESRGRADEPLTVWGEAPAELPVAADAKPELASRGRLVWAARLLVPLTLLTFAFRAQFLQFHELGSLLYVVPLTLQLAALASLYGPISRMIVLVSSREAPFGRFRLVFERIEAAEFSSSRLQQIKKTLAEGDAPASREIARLERVISFADLRHNTLIHLVLNLAVVYDLWVALALERWRNRAGRKVRRWLSAVGELEALASIATYAGEHPSYTWPKVGAGGAELTATEVGHPLIPADRCVKNDVSLAGQTTALLVTGSNMSGKSTYLRSIGLLAVMAQAGLPVCAKGASLTPLSVCTSMRIQDALEHGMSHFYAELVRLKSIVDAAQAGHSVLFLLDEILHGTNSRERSIGARGVVLDLVDRGAIGAVSTHDFALVSIADESNGRVEPVHFSDRIEHGKMRFDYRLKPGVVQSTNAIRLMKVVGIDVAYDEVEDA